MALESNTHRVTEDTAGHPRASRYAVRSFREGQVLVINEKSGCDKKTNRGSETSKKFTLKHLSDIFHKHKG